MGGGIGGGMGGGIGGGMGGVGGGVVVARQSSLTSAAGINTNAPVFAPSGGSGGGVRATTPGLSESLSRTGTPGVEKQASGVLPSPQMLPADQMASPLQLPSSQQLQHFVAGAALAGLRRTGQSARHDAFFMSQARMPGGVCAYLQQMGGESEREGKDLVHWEAVVQLPSQLRLCGNASLCEEESKPFRLLREVR